MERFSQKLKDKLSKIPDQPGVYIMKDKSENIIYIGKAASLKKRVSSYFQKTDHDLKVSAMIKRISDFEFVITDSEVEALILESTLIKQHKPKYNIRLKDDKRYPYIAVTLSEIYPRVIITRRMTNGKDRFFGPYTDVKAARSIVSVINSIFKFRLCSKDLPLKSNERPCLNFQMKRCSGLCKGIISKEEYLDIVNHAVSFLEGKIQPVLDELQKSMKQFSEKHEFEKAAGIRDIIFDINKISDTQKVYSPVGSDKDYIGIQLHGSEAIIILFEFRNGILLSRKIKIYENIDFSDAEEILKDYIIDNYKLNEPPPKIILQNNVKDKDILEKYLINTFSKKVSLVTAWNSEDTGIIRMIGKNLDVIALDRLASSITTDKRNGLQELKNILNLEILPEFIECFDISNTQGTNAVASMVRFKDGLPQKSGYRRYKIKAYDSANDPAMIHEAVSRRLQYLLNEEIKMPDIVVIDGGKTQLKRSLEVKNALNLKIKIISIAKRDEEIFTEDSDESIKLPKSSPALKIIQNIRDEAHRFAITYHKKLRDKDLNKSILDGIPDVGEKKKKILLKYLGSAEMVRNSSVENLRNVPGIGDKTAEYIYNYFHNN